MQKLCGRCCEVKSTDCFSISHGNKDGFASLCKPCVSQKNKEYWRTPKGRLAQMFAAQTQVSRQRGHPAPQYTKEELSTWAHQQGYDALMVAWIASGFDKDLIPSIDRRNPNFGYSLNNIRLVTWVENNEKAYQDRKTCAHITKQNRKVRQLTLDRQLVQVFDSIAAAARATGVQRTNINAMCAGRPQYKSVGGFLWEHV
jgi:hypothetical protein